MPRICLSNPAESCPSVSLNLGPQPNAAPAKCAHPCPPEWILQLARLRADDENLFAHLEICGRCAELFWRGSTAEKPAAAGTSLGGAVSNGMECYSQNASQRRC